MASPAIPTSFTAALADVGAWMKAAGYPAMVIGGVAASILGRPRATRDIDVLAIVPDADWEQLLGQAHSHGLAPRIERPIEFARRTRVLLLRHVRSSIDVDVILGRLPFEQQAVARSQERQLGDIIVRLPQVEDLLIM